MKTKFLMCVTSVSIYLFEYYNDKLLSRIFKIIFAFPNCVNPMQSNNNTRI